jgi:parallel beta-helix repeat protein
LGKLLPLYFLFTKALSVNIYLIILEFTLFSGRNTHNFLVEGGIEVNKLSTVLVTFFIILSLPGIGAAADIFVHSGNSIQNAVNNSVTGDVIIVKPGTYTENVIVNKEGLTIKSESGNPENTLIKARNSGAHVLSLQASNIIITGFKINGATRSGYAGIGISSCSNCKIENNKLLNNSRGIYLLNSKGNTISKNTATNCGEYGIVLASSTGNTLSGNTASNDGRGVHFGNSDGNTLSGNTIQSNSVCGLFICGLSDRNTVYNNYFNDANITIKNGVGNSYNTTKTAGTNIANGPYISGNFWAKPDSTGFSQNAVDADGDGISDSAYNIPGSIYSDYLPLATYKPIPIKPVADFSASPTSGNAPLNVAFTDKSKGSPNAWNWNFGDGTNSTVQSPAHTYSAAGNYTVTLTVSNSAGSNATTKSSYIGVVTVPSQMPVANFWGSPVSGNVPLNVAFTDTTSDSPTAWNWSFGDGTSSTEKNPRHTYSAAGNYTVKLTASNAAGSSTKSKYNYIKAAGIPQKKPVAEFSASPTSGNAPMSVTFTTKSTGSPNAWNWNFGDGTSSTQQNPVHNYSTAGNYTVALTVSNSAGSNTTTKSNYINVGQTAQKPVANFWGSPVSGRAPLNVTFTDTTTGSPTQWNWSFGDGTNSTVKNPKHTYSAAGNYTVKLTASNPAGNSTKSKYSYIKVSKT